MERAQTYFTNIWKTLAIALVVFSFFSFVFTGSANAASGIYRVINFQGKVVNKTAGTNVTNGNYDFTFKIYSVSSAGSPIWTENFNTTNGNQLTVTDGIFRAALGSVCTFSGSSCQGNTNSAVDFNSDSLFLDITFNGETMGSRIQLTAVPYALNAEKVSGLIVTNNGGNTLNIAASKTVTFADTFSTVNSGSDTLTNNTTGFALAGGTTTPKTLTVSDSTTLNTNSIALAGETLTLTSGHSFTLDATNGNTYTLPSVTAGTILTTNQTSQVINSGQTSGTILAINAGTPALVSALTGQTITLNGTNAQAQTGLQFSVSGTGTLKDIVGTGSTWSITSAGALTVASCSGCGGGGTTLQTAYAAGNTITTTAVGDINFTLPDLSTATAFNITEQDPSATKGIYLNMNQASGTVTNGFFIEQTGAGTTTNGINITRTAGAITKAIEVSGTIATSVLDVGGTSILNATGVLQSAGLSGTYSNALTLSSTTNAFTGASISLGTNPAAAGILRIPNATYITARNAANNADINLIQLNSSNLVQFGANTALFTLGGDITGNSNNLTTLASLTVNGGGTISSATSGTLGIGTTTNTTGLTFGNSSNTTGITFNTSVSTGAGFTFSATSLTTGNGLTITPADPEANANSGTLSTGKLINVASTDHTYMTLDNKDLTIGGHKTNVTISGVTDVFVYDTAGDMDGGKWTDGARAQASSWYNETIDNAGGADCNIATMDRCGQQAFPNKAIIVANATNVYIFDAKDNTMWMRFDKGPTTTEWMIGPTNNSTVSTVYAFNGKLYVGNVGSVGQLYSINFISDIAKRYNSTDDYQGNIKVGSRNSAITWVSSVGQPLPGNLINDLNGSVINGKVYIAVAYDPTGAGANGSASIINETDQTIINFGIASNNTASKNVYLTSNGDFYATISNNAVLASATNFFIKAKHSIFNMIPNSNNNAFAEIYGNVGTGSTQYGISVVDAAFGSVTFANGPAPVDATFVPQSLFVTTGTSIDNGRSNTIYVGNNDNLMILQEKQAIPQQGNVKYMTKDYISEYMFSDIRGMWPLAANGSLSLNDVSVKANSALTNNAAATAVSGVRGVGASLNGTSQYLSLADNTALSVTGALSFGGWFKTTNAAAQQYIVTKNGSYTLQVTATGKVQADIIGGTTGTRISANSIDTGWHHVVAVYTPSTLGLDIYIDGILTNGTLSGTVPASITDSAGAFNIGANNGATLFSGAIDDVFVTADSLNSSIIKSMYRVGYRALSNHTSDTLQQLNGSSSQVNAVAVDLEGGTVYAGTTGGGVSVVGTDTDTRTKTYNTGANPDDTGTNFANATVNSVSLSRGFGVGNIIGIGNGSGVWLEEEDTSLKEFLSQSYNPFGTTLVQSTLNVDNTLRVTNQLSTRLDNLAAYNSPQVGLIEFFRADANGAAATAFKGIAGDLNLQSGNTDQIKFLNNAGTQTGRIDAAGLSGDGADGPIAIAASKNLNTDIIGSARTGYADGIAYRVVAPALGATSVTQFGASDVLSNGIAVGDEVLIINLQGSSNDAADVGKYQFMRVSSVTATTLTFTARLGVNLTGTTPSNQKVVVQRVPNYTSVAINASGTLTTGGYEGLATAPTGTAGRLTGIVVFKANGAVTVAGSQTINATGKGYQSGAAGAAGANGGTSGGNVEGTTGVGGSGATAATAGFSGGRGGDGATTTPATNFTTTATAIRTAGGGGGSSGAGTSTGGGAGGGGGSYGTPGGGGGGAGGTTTGGAGGAAGTTVAGGGGGGTDVAGTGGAGGSNVVGVTATGGTNNGVGGAVGTATVTSSGGGGSSTTGGGGGGGTGIIYGTAALSTMFLGSGGGGGGGATNTNVAGGAGGQGGGIVFIAADSVTVTGNIASNGSAGAQGTTKAGGGGGGAGGSVFIQARSLTLGSSLTTATGGAGGTKIGVGGGGGGGGAGRIAYASMVSVAQTTSPAGTNNGTLSDLGTLYIRQTVNTGADLAEDYTSGDDSIQAGDVVAISDTSVIGSDGEQVVNKGVLRKAHGPYEKKLIGVISSDPGVLLGNKDASTDESLYQIHLALTGRVPIKVSTENGPIKIGDYLTSSSTPGVAMKAIKSGVVVAQALENYDQDGTGLISGFVKASYFNGVSLEEYASALSNESGKPLDRLILDQFVATEDSIDPTNMSDILVDRLAAGLEIVTPKVLAHEINADNLNVQMATISGILTVDTIRANRIEGLEILTNKLSSLDSKIATIGATTTPQATSSADLDSQRLLNIESQLTSMNSASSAATLPQGVISLSAINVDGIATVSGNLRVKGNGLFEGVLTILDTLTTNNFIVNGVSTFFQDAMFKAKVVFEGPVTFSSDAGGQAVVTKGTDRVTVSFDQEFEQNPIVNASVSFDEQKDSQGNVVPTDQLEQEFFDQGYSYLIVNKSTKGFTIVLNKKAMDDVNFTWTTLRVKDAKIYQSRLDTSTSQ